jgi:hypothetical protein
LCKAPEFQGTLCVYAAIIDKSGNFHNQSALGNKKKSPQPAGTSFNLIFLSLLQPYYNYSYYAVTPTATFWERPVEGGIISFEVVQKKLKVK